MMVSQGAVIAMCRRTKKQGTNLMVYLLLCDVTPSFHSVIQILI